MQQNCPFSIFNNKITAVPLVSSPLSLSSLSSFALQENFSFESRHTSFSLCYHKSSNRYSIPTEIDVTVILLSIDSRRDLFSNATIPNFGRRPKAGSPAQSRNNREREREGEDQAAARALFMRLTKYRSSRRAARSRQYIVGPAGNFVVRQLKVSRGNSRHKQVERATKAFWRQPPPVTL